MGKAVVVAAKCVSYLAFVLLHVERARGEERAEKVYKS